MSRPVAVFLGVAMALIGVGAFLTGSAARKASAAVVAGNLPVNRGATDPTDLSGNNSPTLARNPIRPANLAVVNRVDNPSFSCALHLSGDGGATWQERPIPFPTGEEDPPRCYAPDVSFDTDGTLYVTFVTLKGLGNVPNAVWIVAASQGGSFGEPVRIAGPLAFQVRLLADPRAPGRLHVSWLQAADVALYAFPTTGNPIVTSRSDDGGSTWSKPVTVSAAPRQRVVAPVPAFGGGSLYLTYLDLGDDQLDYTGAHEGKGGQPYDGTWSLVVARSEDGQKWEETVVDDAIVATERFVVFLPPLPTVAFDARHERLLVAFQDARSGDADVNLWSSSDGGHTFDGPHRVNDDHADGTSQYMAQLSVAPDGRVDIVYFDRRADAADQQVEVSLQSSTDGGRSFRPRLRVSDVAFSSRIGFGQQRGLPDQGNRIGLVSTDRRALAVWTDTRSAVPEYMEQDLARAVISFTPASALRGRLHFIGTVLMAVGALWTLSVVMSRRGTKTAEVAKVDTTDNSELYEEVL